ncbi:hypothetical protein [Halomonas cupida]|uniref:Uncharacterized protein n=1 Tax=Halomonas cupida TaxID=44933 RepID=A0A1M7F2M0_9GAMM|nr:hypothetical protein [Halomonas cupida]GEN23362.1 hypothetical protein HCU01_13110 [Halomonas cupida]SHL97927.1 hypothetical protein SAMN05660971_01893 [Halomonas cupida]
MKVSIRRTRELLGASVLLLTVSVAVSAEDLVDGAGRLAGDVGLNGVNVISDDSLEQVRGRYMPHTGIETSAIDGVILWDERPGRDTGGGRSADHRSANGLNNVQRISVTTQQSR